MPERAIYPCQECGALACELNAEGCGAAGPDPVDTGEALHGAGGGVGWADGLTPAPDNGFTSHSFTSRGL
jgi:hypothetical protein